MNIVPVLAAAFIWNMKRKYKGQRVEVFSISIADIEKALAVRKETNPYMKLPEYYSEFLSIFDYSEAEKLLPLRGPRTNYTIKLEKVNRKEPIIP